MEPSSPVWVGITLRSSSVAEFPAGAGGGGPLRSSAQGHGPAWLCLLPIPGLPALIILVSTGSVFLINCFPVNPHLGALLETVNGERHAARGPEEGTSAATPAVRLLSLCSCRALASEALSFLAVMPPWISRSYLFSRQIWVLYFSEVLSPSDPLGPLGRGARHLILQTTCHVNLP